MASMELFMTVVFVFLTVVTDCSPVGKLYGVEENGGDEVFLDKSSNRFKRETEYMDNNISGEKGFHLVGKRSANEMKAINALAEKLKGTNRVVRSTYSNKDMAIPRWDDPALSGNDLIKLINALNTIRDYLVKQKQSIMEDGRGLLPEGWDQKRMGESVGDGHGLALNMNPRPQPRRRKGPEFNPTGW